MSGKYKVGEDAISHFVTFTVVGWIDVFSREQYKELFLESLKYCQENKNMIIHAWVIMTNHVHLIISSKSNKIEFIVRDLKKYTSKQIKKPFRKIIVKAEKNGC
jgi:putative transposase